MANPGDKVKVITNEEELEGILIKRSELLEDDSIIIKRDDGYNIGVNKDKIKEIQVLKEFSQQDKEEKSLPEKDENLPTISIISAGGTISSKVDYKTGGVYADYTAEDFVEMCPELKNIANIKAKKVMGIMSEDMDPEHWKKLSVEIKKELEEVDGVVVSMGTDTLGYAAAALSFMLDVNKPVILTAAQRSIDRGSSDAFFNLICSVKAASEWDGKEVVTCLHGTSGDEYCSLIKGTKVRKMHTSRRDAFRPINCSEYARVYGDKKIEIIDNSYKKESELKLNNDLDENVGLIYIHPGIKGEMIENYKNYDGVIIAGTGFGHVPQRIYDRIYKLIQNNVFVGITSQCIYGRTSSKVYSPLREMSMKYGMVFLEDMLPETAFVKLSWVLGNEKEMENVKKKMLENLKGEISERIDYNTFLK